LVSSWDKSKWNLGVAKVTEKSITRAIMVLIVVRGLGVGQIMFNLLLSQGKVPFYTGF
jgi:hypothetical protein